MILSATYISDKVFTVRGDPPKPSPQISKVTSVDDIKQKTSINNSKKTVQSSQSSNKSEKINYYSESKHPVFELIKKNNGYCNGSFSSDNFDFNYDNKFNAFTKKNEKTLNRKFLSENYSDNTSQNYLLNVIDETGKTVFISDTKKLAEYYKLEIQLIDKCYFKIKFDKEILTIYPFEPISLDSPSNSSDEAD